MLSTSYRLKLENICNRIEKRETVELSEIIWAEKLSRANRSAATLLRQARRKANNPTMKDGDLDSLLNALDLGYPDPTTHKTSFNSVDELAEWFRRDVSDEGDNWRRRD